MVDGLKQRFPFAEAIARGTRTLGFAGTGGGEPTVGEMKPGRDLCQVSATSPNWARTSAITGSA
jgi:hypothetical protein